MYSEIGMSLLSTKQSLNLTRYSVCWEYDSEHTEFLILDEMLARSDSMPLLFLGISAVVASPRYSSKEHSLGGFWHRTSRVGRSGAERRVTLVRTTVRTHTCFFAVSVAGARINQLTCCL